MLSTNPQLRCSHFAETPSLVATACDKISSLEQHYWLAGRRGRLDVWECRILEVPSSGFMRTSVSSPPESICLSAILALIVYSDVVHADRPPGRSITFVFLCANWRFSN